MNLLFAHDDRVKFDEEGNVYTGGAFNKEVWNRYLEISDSLTVLLRRDKKTYTKNYAKEKFNEFDKKKIKLVIIDDLYDSIISFFSRKKRTLVNKKINEQVKKSDFIIVRLPSNIGNLVVKYAKIFNKPYLVEMVGCPWDALWNHSFKGKLLAPIKYYETKKIVNDASRVLYVTNEFLQHRYPTRGKSIGCSDVSLPKVDENVLARRIEKITSKNRENPIILGTIASVNVRYKGQEYVIRAISKLNNEGYNFEYYLAGDGDNSYLKSIAIKYGVADKVKFLGSIPHDKVFEYLDNIDIYVQPSKQEGLPRALIEAMSRACPALGSRTGGIPELINKEFIFGKGNVNELCILLKKMNNKNILKTEAKRNFEKALEFDQTLLDKKRSQFYKEFAESVGILND